MDEIKTAIKMGSDAIAFYTEAAGRTSNKVGKKMFLSIAEDEKRHLEYLTRLLNKMEFKLERVNPMDRIKTIFSELKDEMSARITATTDEIEVLKIAMRMEREGYDFYKRLSEDQTHEERFRELFKVLMAEEQKHYEAFSNTHSFLTDTGNWFMWSEHSIVEG